MKESLKNRILSYLQRNYPKVISGGELERLAMDAGKKASNASRRLRELENEGRILATYEGRYVSYSFKPLETQPVFTPAPLCLPEQPTLI